MPPLGNSAMPGEMSGVLYTGIKLVEARDAAKHLLIHRVAFTARNVSSPECQCFGIKKET